jgi:phosphopantetheinyl transferase (holo-ACP synthase)
MPNVSSIPTTARAGPAAAKPIPPVSTAATRPSLALHGAVAAALDQLAAELHATLRTHLSLSHDPPTAAAIVLLDGA